MNMPTRPYIWENPAAIERFVQLVASGVSPNKIAETLESEFDKPCYPKLVKDKAKEMGLELSNYTRVAVPERMELVDFTRHIPEGAKGSGRPKSAPLRLR